MCLCVKHKSSETDFSQNFKTTLRSPLKFMFIE